MSNRIQSLHIVYDADGTRTGEIIYIVKKFLGVAHCSACDITHGPRCEKPEFTDMKHNFPVPMFNIHRDEMDQQMTQTVAENLPCVVARTDMCDVLLLNAEALENCNGDVELFEQQLYRGAELCGLALPEKAGNTSPVSCIPSDVK